MVKKEKVRWRWTKAITPFIVGLTLIVFSLSSGGMSLATHISLALAGLIVAGFGLIRMAVTGLIDAGFGVMRLGEVIRLSRLPKGQVMRLAEQRHGLLTLGEISTALNIDPAVARRTLQALSADGIATQRWAEFRKNLWEFPDYMKLPISESIELAKAKGGRLSLNDLISSGYSAETARQTMNALSERGLAQNDPSAAAASPALIVTTQ